MWLQWLRTEASESSTKSSTQGLPDAWEPSGDTGVNLQGFRFFGAVGWQDSGRFALWNGEGMAQVGWGRADISCGHPKLGSWNEIELQFQPRSRKGWSALELSWLRFVRIIIVLAVQYGKEVYVLTFSKFLKRFHWNTCNVFHFYCSMFQCVSFLPSLVPGVRSMGPGLSMSLQGIQSITQIIPTSEACWRWVDIGDMVCSLCPLNCFWVFYKTQEVAFLVFVSSSFL